MGVEERLAGMGVELPEPPAPAGAYAPVTRAGSLLFVSGQIPVRGGRLVHSGEVTDANVGEARESARLCAANVLAQLRAAAPLDEVSVVSIAGFVNSGPGFAGHPRVVDAASELIAGALGARGRHSRTAVGARGLPMGAMTEVAAVASA